MAKKNMTAFEKALTDASLSRYQKILEADTEPVQLSDEYKEGVAKLTKKTTGRTWKYVNTTWKRALVAVITLLLMAATACAAVPALREGLVRFFTHDDGISYSFNFSQDDIDRAPREIEHYFAPSYVPAQYTLDNEEYTPTGEHRYYVDDEGNVLEFQQSVLWQYDASVFNPAGVALRFGVTSENTTIETVILQGYEVRVIHIKTSDSSEDIEFVWTDHEYFYAIGAPSLDVGEIDRIIGSMSPVNPQ